MDLLRLKRSGDQKKKKRNNRRNTISILQRSCLYTFLWAAPKQATGVTMALKYLKRSRMYHRLFHNVLTVAQPEFPVNTEKKVAGKDLSTISIIVVDGICVSRLRSFGRWSLCIGMPPVHMDDDRGSQRFLVKIMVQACEVAPLAVAFLAQRCHKLCSWEYSVFWIAGFFTNSFIIRAISGNIRNGSKKWRHASDVRKVTVHHGTPKKILAFFFERKMFNFQRTFDKQQLKIICSAVRGNGEVNRKA